MSDSLACPGCGTSDADLSSNGARMVCVCRRCRCTWDPRTGRVLSREDASE